MDVRQQNDLLTAVSYPEQSFSLPDILCSTETRHHSYMVNLSFIVE